MKTKEELTYKAFIAAIKERRNAGIDPATPICAFDVVYQIGVETCFQNLSSMEGLYYNNGKPLILISSCRPRGRMAFNCAHEYAHHIFGHGDRVDEVMEDKSRKTWDPEEFIADCFAGFFLMPKSTVCKAFTSRGWSPSKFTPEQAFIISNYIGVGYRTLLTHMHYSLKILDDKSFESMNKVTPKDLKTKILGFDHPADTVILDKHWGNRSVDIFIGDLLVVPEKTRFEGNHLQFISKGNYGLIYQATSQGIDRAHHEDFLWASYIRVTRKYYEGLVQYRHLPEVEHE